MEEELQHCSHECVLTSPEIVARSICNICNICKKDEPVKFTCKPCNFDICEACSKLPPKVSHDFHPEHPLEFCQRQYDQKPAHILCSGCGNMSSSGSFYKCKKCEIYLDLDCALLENIFRGWDAKEMLHYSHAHLVTRSRPGPEARGSCLLCELPLSPFAICYGCLHCYSFFHERCLDLPLTIQHPIHPGNPLRRLTFIRTFSKKCCDACGLEFLGVPFGCLECNFDIHLRCADSLLRGLLHKSHNHRLFYVASTDSSKVFGEKSPCQICKGTCMMSLHSYYHCMECGFKFHFECMEIPESITKKSFHIHPLVCKILLAEEEDFLEYCGVCETELHLGHHAYSCNECGFLGHIECILREKTPSPYYLKDLYSCGKEIRRPTLGGDLEVNKLMVIGIEHIHVMRPVSMSELDDPAKCHICKEKIRGGSPCKCEICNFQTHQFCAELGKPSTHPLHSKHLLILLPELPAGVSMDCDICKVGISGFNLFCRICNFVVGISCALEGKQILGGIQIGQKVVGTSGELCMRDKRSLVQVKVSRSYLTACIICDEKPCGKALSCMVCGDIYHPRCFKDREQMLFCHPLHSDHMIMISLISGGSECIACKLKITEYGYHCEICRVSFHVKCIKKVHVSGIGSHKHTLCNFRIDNSQLALTCNVCARLCGASFYGCIDCNFYAHAECLGFPNIVKNQWHQHIVTQKYSMFNQRKCSRCGSKCGDWIYSCNLCSDVFHLECTMSEGYGKAAGE